VCAFNYLLVTDNPSAIFWTSSSLQQFSVHINQFFSYLEDSFTEMWMDIAIETSQNPGFRFRLWSQVTFPLCNSVSFIDFTTIIIVSTTSISMIGPKNTIRLIVVSTIVIPMRSPVKRNYKFKKENTHIYC
jgi:hypothetical protein